MCLGEGLTFEWPARAWPLRPALFLAWQALGGWQRGWGGNTSTSKEERGAVVIVIGVVIARVRKRVVEARTIQVRLPRVSVPGAEWLLVLHCM